MLLFLQIFSFFQKQKHKNPIKQQKSTKKMKRKKEGKIFLKNPFDNKGRKQKKKELSTMNI